MPVERLMSEIGILRQLQLRHESAGGSQSTATGVLR
jgi:hypothetical protein